MKVRLCLDLPEDVRHVTTTRHMSRSLLEHLQIVEEDIDDIEAVVGEARPAPSLPTPASLKTLSTGRAASA